MSKLVSYKRELKSNAEKCFKAEVKKEHKSVHCYIMFLPFFLFEVFFFVPVFIFGVFVLVSHFCSPPNFLVHSGNSLGIFKDYHSSVVEK